MVDSEGLLHLLTFIVSRVGVLIGDVCDLRLELLRIRRADLKSLKLFVLRPHNFKQSKSTYQCSDTDPISCVMINKSQDSMHC